ncbi:MAG: hypothetical protein ACQER0_02660, partial [Bacillota bacterium]
AIIEKSNQFIEAHPEIFSKKYEVFNEYLLKAKTNLGEKQYRIDRLLVDRQNKLVKIIDYKSGSYRDPEQLKSYKEILAAKLDSDWQLETEFMDI